MLRDEEVQILASEAFNRCWQFLERDPVLAGQDRQDMQEKLARHILRAISAGERSLQQYARRAGLAVEVAA